MQSEMHEAEESQYIREATAILQQHTGKQPEGWLGPWISESHVTLDLLQVDQCILANAVSCPLRWAALVYVCTHVPQHPEQSTTVAFEMPTYATLTQVLSTVCHAHILCGIPSKADIFMLEKVLSALSFCIDWHNPCQNLWQVFLLSLTFVFSNYLQLPGMGAICLMHTATSTSACYQSSISRNMLRSHKVRHSMYSMQQHSRCI